MLMKRTGKAYVNNSATATCLSSKFTACIPTHTNQTSVQALGRPLGQLECGFQLPPATMGVRGSYMHNECKLVCVCERESHV